jgi:uncharacterized membrane protein (UPF0127 family)
MLKRMLLVTLLFVAGLARAELPRIDLSAGFYRINAEVAFTEPTRQQGLMGRRAMAPQEGMLFVFDRAMSYCMWMRNTFIPLSVAFIDAKGVIINIEDMKPQTEDPHCAAGEAKYALEMNQGWFATRKIGPGSKIGGIDRAPPAR